MKGTHFGYGVLSSSILDVYRLSAQGYALWAPLLCKGCERTLCGPGGECVLSVAKASAHRVGHVRILRGFGLERWRFGAVA